MASENVDNWDQPLYITTGDDFERQDEGLTFEERREKENMEKLGRYVENMYYIPVPPKPASPRTEMLTTTRKRTLTDNARDFGDIVEPRERGVRFRRLASQYNTFTTEEVEQAVREKKAREYRQENIAKRKQEIYYELLNKLERQCRLQYLNVLMDKFTSFISKLATTMRIPPHLVDPYARMQRGIFCNILLAIGVQPASQSALYYNTKEGSEYEVCHKLSHALLSLIIKALDSASTRDGNEVQPLHPTFEMDKYIKDRLMCAAEKKVQNALSPQREVEPAKLSTLLEKCKNYR